MRLYRGIGLDDRSAKYKREARAVEEIRAAIRGANEDEREIADRVLAKVGPILDRAITTEAQPLPLDVARIDLVARGRAFAAAIEEEETDRATARADTEALTVAIRKIVDEAARKDPVLVSLVEKLDTLVKRYNEGALTPASFAKAVKEDVLDAADARDTVAREEGLSREELVVFDTIMERASEALVRERDAVKDCVRQLSQRLDRAMGLDWQMSEQGRARVKVAVEQALDELPEEISNAEVDRLATDVFRYVIERGWTEA